MVRYQTRHGDRMPRLRLLATCILATCILATVLATSILATSILATSTLTRYVVDAEDPDLVT